MKAGLFALAALGMIAAAPSVEARDHLRVASSSTVFPFAALVSEALSKSAGIKAPVIESLGSGGALKLFCSGAGDTLPDIATASRPISEGERTNCAAHGVTDIAEIAFGFDGIVVAAAKGSAGFPITARQLYLALAKTVPVNGHLIANPYTTWHAIDPSLPRDQILVFGPAPNHGTRDILVELVMDPACGQFPEIQKLDHDAKVKACGTLREDGPFIDVSENYNVLLRKLAQDPHAIGLLPFSYVDQNADKIKALPFNGREPTADAIFKGDYSLARPLFLYVKKARLGRVEGLRRYIEEFTSERAWGDNGYLVDHGLIPLPAERRAAEAAKARALAP